MKSTKEQIINAYHIIHDQLSLLPPEYCCWKEKNSDGAWVAKTIWNYYYPVFHFIRNKILRKNLAELRMCFDYHHSLYKLHKPGLTFGWQHKLILCQLVAQIHEGIMLDLLENFSESEHKKINKELLKEKLNKPSFGLGSMIELFYKSKIIDETWKEYLKHLNYLRNTVHPKALNLPDASFDKNPLLKKEAEILIKNLDKFIANMKKKYLAESSPF